MKITVLGPLYPYRGGISKYTREMCRQLTRSGHNVTALTYKRMYPGWLFPGKSQMDPSLVGEAKGGIAILDPFDVISWNSTVKAILASRPDLVVIEWWVTYWALPYCWIRNRVQARGFPVVFQIHNVLPHEARWLDRGLAKLALARADGFLVHSDREGQRLDALLGPGSKVVVKRALPMLAPAVQKAGARAMARSQLGIPEQARVILFFGHVRPYKGLAVLIDAMALLAGSHPDTHLVVAGEFWEDVEPYRRRARELDLAERVHMIDRYIPEQEVDPFFALADVFVAPYIGGSQSGALKIAMGYGLPVVMSDSIVDDMTNYPGANWRVFSRGDPNELAGAIRAVLNQHARPDMASRIRKSWGDLVDGFVTLQQQVASEGRQHE